MIPKSAILVVVLSVVGLRSVSARNCYSCSGDSCTNGATFGEEISCATENDQCYTVFAGFLPTARGCLAEAGEGLCPGDNCVTCADSDNCNKLSRANHMCVTCSSETDPQCYNNPGALQATQCEAATVDVEQSQCYSRINGKVTDRGCVRSKTLVDNCVGATCQTCTGEGCNNAEFPAGRQKCVGCSGDAAACNANDVTALCELASDSCVTLQRGDGTYVKACEGAMAATDISYCQANPSKCSYCGLLECNTAQLNVVASKKCYHCEGTGCLQTSVNIETCHNSDDVCHSVFDGFNPIMRGCTSQLDADQKLKCADANDKSCQTCEGNACNLVSHVDHKCEYCSSVFDTNCIAAPTNEVRCPAPSTEVSSDAQCYTRVVGSVTERGCLGSAADALECESTENCQTCAIADGQACNKALFPTDRIRCVVGTVANQYCPNPADNCVQIAGTTITKKCESSMTSAEVAFCEANSNKCDFCWGNNCNQQAVTFNYLECFSCQSSADAHCTTNPSAIFTVDQCTTCATVYSSTTNTLKRGCLSGLTTAEQALCSAGDSTCSTCTTNRCNGAVFPSTRLACYKCLTPPCNSHEVVSLEYCQAYVSDDTCVTITDATTGRPTRMGCKSSLTTAQQTACSSSSSNCKQCSVSGCNNPLNVAGATSCVQCSSSSDSNCIGGASSIVVQPCNDPQNSACYSRRTSTGVTERGCLSDLDSSSASSCRAGTSCLTCSNRARCNSYEYPNQIKCFQCDSTQTPECKNNQLGSPSYCSSYNPSNKCFTVVQENGDTVRKCATGARNVTCGSSHLCEECLFNGCNKRVSTSIMPTVIAEPTRPTKGAANGSLMMSNLALLLMVVASATVRSMFVR